MPGMGGTPPLALPGFYFSLAIEAMVWLVLAMAIFAAVWALSSRANGFSQSEVLTIGAESTEVKGRGFLRIALGGIWILDGLLQAQPAMAGNFATQVIAPLNKFQPSLLQDLIRWEVYLWQDHAVVADVATVLIQIGLGVSILAGKDTIAGRIGLWLSIGWALAVWVGGEALGGLLVRGASELFGAPGAVLAYAAAAGLLLLPVATWKSGKVSKIIRNGLGGTLIFGAALQGIPFEGFWGTHRLSSMFSIMATTPQPSYLSAPITSFAGWTSASPMAWEIVIIAVLAALGIALLSGRAIRAWSCATGLWLVATWWLAQDFGFLGGVGTDPNLNVPLFALLIAGELTRSYKSPSKLTRLARHRLKVKNPLPSLSSLKPTRLPLRQAAAISGLAAMTVGVLPALLVMPSALGQPAALHISPPPLATNPIVPLATMAGEINVFVQASRGRLEVSLQAPSSDPSSGSSPATKFQLSGKLTTAAKQIVSVRWLGCGQGCFVANADWAQGVSQLVLKARAANWSGGTSTFDIPWPPRPNNAILGEVVAAMRSVRSIAVQEAVSSDTSRPPWTSSGSITGAELLSNEPFGSGKSPDNVVVLGHGHATTKLAFDYPAEDTYVEMTIGSNYRIISESLTGPQHLILANFRYS